MEDTASLTLGKRILYHRKRLGLTQDQLALLVETSTDTIGRIERKQKIASYEVLFRIARYFHKPVEDVFWYE